MDVRKEMPKEVKDEVIDGKKRVVTLEIPKKYKDKIDKKRAEERELAQRFYQISMQVTRGQRALVEISEKLDNIKTSVQGALKDSAKKLKLKKQKDRQWRFDGRGSFIGVYNPSKNKK